MTYKGRFSKGTVVLPPNVDIPEGAEVEVIPVQSKEAAAERQGPSFYERYRKFVGVCEGPEDLAENHDHYIHGIPKR